MPNEAGWKAAAAIRKLERAFHAEMLASKPGSAKAVRFANAANIAEMCHFAATNPKMVDGLIRTMKGRK
jgi:hypothetical protein